MTVLDCLELLRIDTDTYTDILDREISIVTDNSRCIVPNCVFVCITGRHFDGHSVAQQALEQGALLVVAEKKLDTERTVQVDSTPSALSVLSQAMYGFPSKDLELIGITGTNGKTTIGFMIKGILDSLGYNAGLIGTVRNELGNIVIPSKFTTPTPSELAELFSAMRTNSIEKVAMEVSSQALAQGRVAGLLFEVGIFTNLTQDHLDYHGDMQSYFNAKKLLANQSKRILINIDDAWWQKLCEEYSSKAITFSETDSSADYYATAVHAVDKGMHYTLHHVGISYEVDVPVFGGFSVMNSMQAIGALAECGVDILKVIDAMKNFGGVPGRTELLYSDAEFKIIRDYAHTPSAIESVLHDFKQYVKHSRIVVLFGCAGNRDRTKRVDMARAAASHSDFVILTSDNPRDENEIQIIDDALPGLVDSGVEYITIPDRYTAILWAIEHRRAGDLLLLLGKGHEDYQVLKDGTIYFDEAVIVSELMSHAKTQRLLGDV